MIKEIFIKELREHIASTTMIVVFTIIILLFLANSIAFLKKYSSHALQYQQMNLALYDDLKDSSGSLLELTFTDYDLIYPPSIFGFMADGSQNLLPNGIQLDFFHISTPKLYQQADNYIFDTMELDWNNILVFLISFVCIFFSYNSFSGEKKQGTLKLIISNQVSRAQIVLGKYLGVCCLILLPFIVGVIITIVVLRFSSAIHITYHHYAIVLYYILASIIFISLNVLMGMFISAVTSKPIESLSIILLIWLFFAIVIPGVGWTLSRKITPVESLRVINDRLMAESKALGERRWDDRWNTPIPEVKAEKRLDDRYNNIVNSMLVNYRHRLFMQVSSGISITNASPFHIFRVLGEKISDTGFFRFKNFEKQVTDYHLVYKEFIVSKDQEDQDSHHLIFNDFFRSMKFMSKKPVTYKEIPKFEYRSHSFIQKLDVTKWELFILFIWNFVLFLGVTIAFRKYDVR